MRVTQVTAGPLNRDEGPRGPRIARRVRGISLEIVAFFLVSLLSPLLIAGAAIVDLVLWLLRRKPWVGVRLVGVLWWFLFVEVRALGTMAWIWISTGGPLGGRSMRRRRILYDLRIRWARRHLNGIRAIFGLTFEVENLESAGPGPVVIMMRHASIIDNMLPDALIGHEHGMGLRFVLKRELEVLPTIDIGARWVPTNFVRRASADTAGEVAALRGLATDLGPGEGIMIYPEGTRFTAAKAKRAQQVIAERQPQIAGMAQQIKNVLPPRLGGPLALLDEAAGVDVVFCGHVGFDGFAKVSDIWAGRLVGSTIRVRFWRYPGNEVPSDEHERVAWLYERWQTLDDWVGEWRSPDSK